MRISLLFFGFVFLLFFSCRDEDILTDSSAKLEFSTDTVMFDTVFSGIGSATKRFRVYNRNKQTVKIASVWLGRGQSSCFKVNVDGMAGNRFDNLEIRAGDSLFVFVEVRINPSENDLLESDSLCFSINGNFQNVKMQAFGQNVHLLSDQVLTTQTWTADKPYLIYKSVLVDTLQTLTVLEGAKIYFHQGASLFVKGSLRVLGRQADPVHFQSDRLESFYSDKPGQWGAYTYLPNGAAYLFGGLHFFPGSFNNEIDYAIIKNANKGIQIDSAVGTAPALRISNTIVANMNTAGIYAQTSYVLGNNLVINNCGTHAIALVLGGKYNFNHTTVANYTPYSSRRTASVALNNYYVNNGVAYVYEMQEATFTNTIIYGDGGDNGNEVIIDKMGDVTFNYLFDYCMIKIDEDSDYKDDANFTNVIWNPDGGPRFISRTAYDFQLDTLSPAIDAGKMDYGLAFPTDLNGATRTGDAAPDLGAYER